MNPIENKKLQADVVLIGAGIMSATLGVMLKLLEPGLRIQIFERLDTAAAESSDAWNNAGTGHSAFCELNYTPQKADGSIDIAKAIAIAASFEMSKEFWAFLVSQDIINTPAGFIRNVPHMSFVWGEQNVAYLHQRQAALTNHHLFRGMAYSEDHRQLAEWMPLVMEGREPGQPVAATRMDIGTDVNFGALTRCLFEFLQKQPDVRLYFNHDVRNLYQDDDDLWRVKVKDEATGDKRTVRAPFVFIGAGGGSLPLLEKSDIPEGHGYGGFPVSGQWLVCRNEAVVARHDAKVYGKAAVGSPPMSVPHLDTRVIGGRKALLFGPYAGFSTRFLKHGSLLDLPRSLRLGNLRPMISAGMHNLPLTRYLIDQVRQSPEERMDALRDYLPTARTEDWELETAGQRVQIIKKDEEEGGILEFGTEVVSAADGSLAALLGASPGASTSVAIMLQVIERCFPKKVRTEQWQRRLRELVPSYGQSLATDAALAEKTRAWSSAILGLER